ncbi:MAG: hypothetical protein COB30_002760 [Ectothiorhodospiraceae bacterium]|nr:hypothetical protein [Ectothiorhodospiraceae bacterium]
MPNLRLRRSKSSILHYLQRWHLLPKWIMTLLSVSPPTTMPTATTTNPSTTKHGSALNPVGHVAKLRDDHFQPRTSVLE